MTAELTERELASEISIWVVNGSELLLNHLLIYLGIFVKPLDSVIIVINNGIFITDLFFDTNYTKLSFPNSYRNMLIVATLLDLFTIVRYSPFKMAQALLKNVKVLKLPLINNLFV